MNHELRIMNKLTENKNLLLLIIVISFIIHHSSFIIPSARAQFDLPTLGNNKPSAAVGDIDLTWTTNSKSPVFYRAKSLPTQNSIVTISALPFIYKPGTKNLISSKNLIYNWRINDKLDFEQSGKNKFSYNLNVNDFFGNLHSIRLEVKTEDGTAFLEKEMQIPIVKPQIWLYFSDPKTNQPFGIALKNLTAKIANFSFRAEAYFFTIPLKNLKWQWFINSTEVAGIDEKQWLATLNLANNFYGPLSAQIKVTAKNPNDELEGSESITNLEIK